MMDTEIVVLKICIYWLYKYARERRRSACTSYCDVFPNKQRYSLMRTRSMCVFLFLIVSFCFEKQCLNDCSSDLLFYSIRSPGVLPFFFTRLANFVH